MSDFPDFSHYHYRVEKELGHNRAGGRVTYLAVQAETQQHVVIKQFQFAKAGVSWSEYEAYDREIQLLKELNYPGIPRYLDAFQTPNGFCMVQEYKNAASLAEPRSFSPETIQRIAIAALEVLVYLQNRIPSVIHRDIKPENILVDEQGGVYLVDFGFARVGAGEVGMSSVVKGTLGFMPPEQLFNRQLTEASDLYGLGMTLICLLTGTKSDCIGDLVDISYRVSFRHLVPTLSVQWVNWLEKMVEPRLKDRFPNAMVALQAIPTAALRPPEAQFSCSSLVFKAAYRSETLSQSVVIRNPVPETVLEGRWQAAPHPHDPDVAWIGIEPKTFAGNHVTCEVAVDTRYLMAGKTYSRQLLLHTNTSAKTYSLNLRIQTAPTSIPSQSFPYLTLLLLGLVVFGISWFASWLVLVTGTVSGAPTTAGIGAMMSAAIGLELAAWMLQSSGSRIGATANTLVAIGLGGAVLIKVLSETIVATGVAALLGGGAGLISGILVGIGMGLVVERLIARGDSQGVAIIYPLLMSTFASSLGVGTVIGFANLIVMALAIVAGLSLAMQIGHLYLQRLNLLLSHRKSERYLIKP